MSYSERFLNTSKELNIPSDNKFLNYLLYLTLKGEEAIWIKLHKKQQHVSLQQFLQQWKQFQINNTKQYVQFLPSHLMVKIKEQNCIDKILEIQKNRIDYIVGMIENDILTINFPEYIFKENYCASNILWYRKRTSLTHLVELAKTNS